MTTPVTPTAAEAPRNLMRQVVRANLHPGRDMHASWLPPDWPAQHRTVSRLGPAGQAVLGDWLAREHPPLAPDYRCDTPMRRLALIDGRSLRRLAVYCGFGVHKPLFEQRGIGRVLRRQANRYDRDAASFVIDRMPAIEALQMNTAILLARPAGAGRLMVNRGYRLLTAVLRHEDEQLQQRVARKLPRRVSQFDIPPLSAAQRQQLQELMLLCIVPERLGQWDWLF